MHRSRLGLRLTVGALLTAACVVATSSVVATAAPPTKPLEAPAADPFNDRIGVTVGADGRFSEGAFPDPDSGNPRTGSYTTLYGWPNTGTSFTSLRVDGVDSTFGSADGTMVQPPTDVDPNTDRTVWKVGDISVRQEVQLVINPATGQRDTAQISYTMTNQGSVAHSVGTRMMLDTDVNNNDGAPFRIAGVGAVTTEQDLSGSAVPDAFQVFQNLADSTHIAAAVLRGGATTPPDRLVVAAWPRIFATKWDYATTPGSSVTGDSAYATYWNPAPLNAGQSRTVATAYGLADVSVDLTPPLALGVSGPATLTRVGGAYSPNPFTVTATVSDAGAGPAPATTLTLDLPAGLRTSAPLTASVGDLTPGGGERTASWSVTADPSSSGRTLRYSVSARATNTATKTVTRQIVLPATQVAGTFGPGWNRSGDFTLYYSYGGAHRYLGNVGQGAANWNGSGTPVTLQTWSGVPLAIHIDFVDVSLRDTYWGVTLAANNCYSCPYTRNRIVLNSRTLDSETDVIKTKVATHELGHAIALEHPTDAGFRDKKKLRSVMWQGRLPYNTPQPYDTDRVNALYQ